MLQSKGYAVYANSKVQTASPAELTLMLYEAAIKFCNIAEMAIEKMTYRKHTIISKGRGNHRRISGHPESQISGSKGL